jgi:hypothetical protein
MGTLWLKIKVWTKIALFSLLVIYALCFVFNNVNKPMTVWLWFGKEPQTSLLPVIFFSFVIGVVGTLLVRTTIKTIRQIRDIRDRGRTERMAREMAEMKSKAERLQTKPSSAIPEATAAPAPAASETSEL